ncbi:MAG: protein N-terminal glutamine amidohydrolase [Lentisphaeraceae bacterium]|nr:protein N-terminal glutamine amidohydrolase [Lentisphaeraceae bacterium]
MNNFSKEIYTQYFCEENIWQLAKSFNSNDRTKLYVLLLSNQKKTIALANQRAAKEGEIIIWDYHVILYNEFTKEIFDFDTRLNHPENLNSYLNHTFGDQLSIPQEFQTYCRKIPADVYLNSFHSDRTHMLDEENNPIQEFPLWPKISSKQPVSLDELLDFTFQTDQISEFQPVDSLLK